MRENQRKKKSRPVIPFALRIRRAFFMPVLVAGAMFSLVGCAHPVTRTGADKPFDLSGKWNDTDSRLAAASLIEDVFSDGWLKEFRAKNRRKPVITTARIANRAHEHISAEPLMNALTAALLKSGEVSFVASAAEREQTVAERQDYEQSNRVSTEAAINSGADFLLTGEIHTIVDELMNKKVVFYQIDMALLSLENNLTVWEGQSKIKKIIEKPKVAW